MPVAKSWLRGGVGTQPASAEVYDNTGSLYLCTVGLVQLGLPATDEFRAGPSCVVDAAPLLVG